MFDVGFSELLVIAVVALLVLGPERLPRLARMAGLLLGRLQRYVQGIKVDLHREMQLEELRQLQAQLAESKNDAERSVQQLIQEPVFPSLMPDSIDLNGTVRDSAVQAGHSVCSGSK